MASKEDQHQSLDHSNQVTQEYHGVKFPVNNNRKEFPPPPKKKKNGM